MQSVRDACVTARCIQQTTAVPQQATSLRVSHDCRRCPIFYGSAWIRPLGLSQYLDPWKMRGQPLQPNERSLADAFQNASPKRFCGSNHASQLTF